MKMTIYAPLSNPEFYKDVLFSGFSPFKLKWKWAVICYFYLVPSTTSPLPPLAFCWSLIKLELTATTGQLRIINRHYQNLAFPLVGLLKSLQQRMFLLVITYYPLELL